MRRSPASPTHPFFPADCSLFPPLSPFFFWLQSVIQDMDQDAVVFSNIDLPFMSGEGRGHAGPMQAWPALSGMHGGAAQRSLILPGAWGAAAYCSDCY